jgi:hypothetical protein
MPTSNIHIIAEDEFGVVPPVRGNSGIGSGVAVGNGGGVPGTAAAMVAGRTLMLPQAIRDGETRTHDVRAVKASPLLTPTSPTSVIEDLNSPGIGMQISAGPSSRYEETTSPMLSTAAIK